MRVAVVGPGALGTLLAGVLARRGAAEVTLIDHQAERAALIQRQGLIVEEDADSRGPGGPSQPIEVRATARPDDAAPSDLVLVAVKARDTKTAAAAATAALAPDGLIVSLQNGLGNVEALADAAGWERVIAGLTTHGATLLAPGRVRHTGAGRTVLAAAAREGPAGADGRERAERAASALRELGLACEVDEDWRALLWRKVTVNAAVNALTALLRVPNGALLRSEAARDLATEAAREAARVAAANGITTADAAGEDEVEAAARRALDVMETTAANRSSALQDALAGRPLEVEAINGEVARAATRAGVPAPINQLLTRLARAHDDLADCRVRTSEPAGKEST